MNEILHYQCIVDPHGYRIVLKGRRFRSIGLVLFQDRPVEPDGDLPTLVLPRSDYSNCIDMLRNEKPVYFEAEQPTPSRAVPKTRAIEKR